jgi:glycine betaine/proline transport system ATP-binding protein
VSKVEVKDLTKIFGKSASEGLKLLEKGSDKDEIFQKTGLTVGVNKASFNVEDGEFFVIMGLSGSGKSTLIRLLNRLIEPTGGQIWIDGDSVIDMNDNQLRKVRRKKMGMVFQRFGLFPHRTILNNVTYGLEVQGISAKEREQKGKQVLELVGLGGLENQYPDQLSGGMQQRVGLARALAIEPDILLMDEAFSALDPLIRKEMQNELLELQAKLNKTIVFITHDLDEALKLGDRIAIMKDGAIVQIGTPEEILTHPADDYVADFLEGVDRSKILTAEHVMFKPDVVHKEKDGPRVAAHKMKERGISSIFVTAKDGELKGLLTIDDCLKAINRDDKSVENSLIQDFQRISPETPLNDLFELAIETKYPIAVVKDEKLKGILVRASILTGLIGGKERMSNELH